MSQNAKKLKCLLIQIMLKDGFSSHFVSHWRSATLDINSHRCFDGQYKSRDKKEEIKSNNRFDHLSSHMLFQGSSESHALPLVLTFVTFYHRVWSDNTDGWTWCPRRNLKQVISHNTFSLYAKLIGIAEDSYVFRYIQRCYRA